MPDSSGVRHGWSLGLTSLRARASPRRAWDPRMNDNCFTAETQGRRERPRNPESVAQRAGFFVESRSGGLTALA